VPILPCHGRLWVSREGPAPCRICIMSETLGVASLWLSDEELSTARGTLPILYVEAVPVRVDAAGRITGVGLLLRARPDGTLSRAVVAGRVMYKERIRDALIRHLEKDLGPVALPRLPVSISPFTVVEYFPDPTVTGFHDPRQHAVALAYVVPVDGDCEPSQSAIDLAWLTPDEATSEAVLAEFSGGQDRLIRLAMAFGGRLP
jgi:ADP-ribose pyrophosphatase YjhB (NUDIX family)